MLQQTLPHLCPRVPLQPPTDYYNTSKGCPMGTYPSVDSSGDDVCKRF